MLKDLRGGGIYYGGNRKMPFSLYMSNAIFIQDEMRRIAQIFRIMRILRYKY